MIVSLVISNIREKARLNNSNNPQVSLVVRDDNNNCSQQKEGQATACPSDVQLFLSRLLQLDKLATLNLIDGEADTFGIALGVKLDLADC